MQGLEHCEDKRSQSALAQLTWHALVGHSLRRAVCLCSLQRRRLSEPAASCKAAPSALRPDGQYRLHLTAAHGQQALLQNAAKCPAQPSACLLLQMELLLQLRKPVKCALWQEKRAGLPGQLPQSQARHSMRWLPAAAVPQPQRQARRSEVTQGGLEAAAAPGEVLVPRWRLQRGPRGGGSCPAPS